MDAKLHRRWFRFSLRTLLVFVTIASAGFGWIGMQVRKVHRQRVAVEAIKKMGGCLFYDYEVAAFLDDIPPKDPSIRPAAIPPGPEWLRKVVGDDFLAKVVKVDRVPAEFSDDAMVHFATLVTLRQLDLNFTDVTDAGLGYLEGLRDLQALDLGHTQVTDAGLVHFKQLDKLRWLNLTKTDVTDSGLIHLRQLAQLRDLYLLDTQVTNAGCLELQKWLPNLEIHR
jgi:hypothetical protein